MEASPLVCPLPPQPWQAVGIVAFTGEEAYHRFEKYYFKLHVRFKVLRTYDEPYYQTTGRQFLKEVGRAR